MTLEALTLDQKAICEDGDLPPNISQDIWNEIAKYQEQARGLRVDPVLEPRLQPLRARILAALAVEECTIYEAQKLLKTRGFEVAE